MLNHRDLEESVSRLDTVDAVRIVSDGDKVTEVHIVAAPSKPAKQVVRDIQSLAMARFGINRRQEGHLRRSVGGRRRRPEDAGAADPRAACRAGRMAHATRSR